MNKIHIYYKYYIKNTLNVVIPNYKIRWQWNNDILLGGKYILIYETPNEIDFYNVFFFEKDQLFKVIFYSS